MTNTFSVAGHVGKDPESKDYQNGKTLVNFSVASKTGKDKTSWFNCTAFGKTAELVNQYVKKGSLIYVSGHIEIEKYEEKYYTKVIANSVSFLGSKKEDAGQQPETHKGLDRHGDIAQPKNDMDDDIPF